jgi:spore germination protein YaaH
VNTKKLLAAAFTFFGTLLVIAVVGWVIWQFINPQFENLRNRENNELIPFHEHFDADPAIPHIIWEGERLRDVVPPIIHNGTAYLPVEFVRAFLDPFMFWDANAQKLFVTTRTDMRTFRHGDIRVTADGVYVPADLLMMLYPFSVQYHAEFNMVVVSDDRLPQHTAAVLNPTPVRYRPDVSAPITQQLNAGERVTLFTSNQHWTRVRTRNGLLGYVQTASLGTAEIQYTEINRVPIFRDFVDNFAPHSPAWTGGKINLVWKNPYNADAIHNSMQAPLPQGLTVVSPTWFRFNAETKSLDSIASAEYVQWAHEQGVQVWPNVNDTLAGRTGIAAILSDEYARRRIISQLVDAVEAFNLDGISMNIEHLIDFQYGPYFVQFMRELNIAMGDRITLIAAMKVDPVINRHYRHDLIAQTIDFIALMTYDEHVHNPGPVASLPWVEQHLSQMLPLVPANQLLLGLPFYNRIWRTTITDSARRPSGNWGMDRTIEEFDQRGVVWEWDDIIGSYYAEFAEVVDGETLRHQVWLECPRSINEKLQLYVMYNLAGVAGWSMGFTNDALWELIGTYFP